MILEQLLIAHEQAGALGRRRELPLLEGVLRTGDGPLHFVDRRRRRLHQHGLRGWIGHGNALVARALHEPTLKEEGEPIAHGVS